MGSGGRILARLLTLGGWLWVTETDGWWSVFSDEAVSRDDVPPLMLLANDVSFSFGITLWYGGGGTNEGVNDGNELTGDGGAGLLEGVDGGGGDTEGRNEVPAT